MKCFNLSILILFILATIFFKDGYGWGKSECGEKYWSLGNVCGKDVCPNKNDTLACLSCCELDVLRNGPEDDDAANFPLHLQMILVISIFLSALFSGTALFFHWWNAYTVYFGIYRRFQIMEKKMLICEKKLSKRVFSDALMGKLGDAANFEYTPGQNDAETVPLTGATTGPDGPPVKVPAIPLM